MNESRLNSDNMELASMMNPTREQQNFYENNSQKLFIEIENS